MTGEGGVLLGSESNHTLNGPKCPLSGNSAMPQATLLQINPMPLAIQLLLLFENHVGDLKKNNLKIVLGGLDSWTQPLPPRPLGTEETLKCGERKGRGFRLGG